LLAQAICNGQSRDSCTGDLPRAPGPAPLDALPPPPFPLKPFYSLRDHVFSATASGRRYTQLYYQYGREVSQLVLTHPQLMFDGTNAAAAWEDSVDDLADERGDTAVISSIQIAALNGFIEELKSVASPELKAVLTREQAALDLPSLAGKTMTQAL